MYSFSPTVITIMLVSGGISQWNSILKVDKMFREYKFDYHSESHRDRHYVRERWDKSMK